MTTILYSNNEIEDKYLYLDEPKRIKGGAFYSKLFYKDKPLHLQTTICSNKNGMIETNKKKYIDLLFQENKNSILWIDKLETIIKRKIREKNEDWFSNSMEEEDINEFFNSCFRRYKNDSYLVRTYLKDAPYQVSIFDEKEKEISIEDIKKRNMIAIIHFHGIKFTNTTLLLQIYIKQILLLDTEEEHKCMINKKVIFSDENTEKENKLNTQDENKIKIEEDDNQEETSNESREKQPDTIHKEEPMNESREKQPDTIHMEESTNEPREKDSETISKEEKDETLDKSQESNNVYCEIEEFTDKIVPLENETMKLKQPNKVYYDIYKDIRKRIRYAKKLVVEGYLEARRIKKLYLLDDLENDTSDEEEDLDYLSDVSTEELMKYNDELNKYL